MEHGYQHATGQRDNWNDPLVQQKCEQQAMVAENAIAYAFYMKVPGYRKGEPYQSMGPRTCYRVNGTSMLDGSTCAVQKDMTWDDYWPGLTPLF